MHLLFCLRYLPRPRIHWFWDSRFDDLMIPFFLDFIGPGCVVMLSGAMLEGHSHTDQTAST